jgi:tRNA-methyltransferase O
MKKLITAAARKFQKSPMVTIGLDLGDRFSHYCVLDESGRILTESKTVTSPNAMEEVRLGATICGVRVIEGTSITVEGLDAIDGTPVLDIKPYMRQFKARGEVRQPHWADEMMSRYWSASPGAHRGSGAAKPTQSLRLQGSGWTQTELCLRYGIEYPRSLLAR